MNGIIIIDKPENYTSFDVIAVLRKKLHQKKIGHMGTLDPMATGVLPILLGETAKFQIFTNHNDKEYTAKMQLGIVTDTLDITGKIISITDSLVKREEFQNALKIFEGEILQTPPMFSAIKKGGQKLCDLARKGVEIYREKRKITIKSLKLLEFDEKNQTAVIKVLCSQGTYIRSLCDDIGKHLNCGAAMSSLRRTRSNGFCEDTSITLETLQTLDIEEIQKKYVLPTEYLFKNNIKINVTTAQAQRFLNGGALSRDRIFTNKSAKNFDICRVYCNENFIGLGKIIDETNEIKVLKCLHTK